MKITRALLLSSKKQAESWERTFLGSFIVAQYRTDYRYLVTDQRQNSGQVRIQIFRVTQKEHEGKKYNVLADEPHVEETFEDIDGLTRFLCEHKINVEDDWHPVED